MKFTDPWVIFRRFDVLFIGLFGLTLFTFMVMVNAPIPLIGATASRSVLASTNVVEPSVLDQSLDVVTKVYWLKTQIINQPSTNTFYVPNALQLALEKVLPQAQFYSLHAQTPVTDWPAISRSNYAHFLWVILYENWIYGLLVLLLCVGAKIFRQKLISSGNSEAYCDFNTQFAALIILAAGLVVLGLIAPSILLAFNDPATFLTNHVYAY